MSNSALLDHTKTAIIEHRNTWNNLSEDQRYDEYLKACLVIENLKDLATERISKSNFLIRGKLNDEFDKNVKQAEDLAKRQLMRYREMN